MPDSPPKTTVRKIDPPKQEHKPPPPKEEPKDKPPTGTRKPPGRPPDLQKRLEGAFTTIAMMVAFYNRTDGQIVAAHAPELAEAWYGLAKENAKVKEILERMLAVEAGGSVLFVTGSVAVQIAMNHGVVAPLPGMGQEPPDNNGTAPPGQPNG